MVKKVHYSKRFWTKAKLGSPDDCWEWQAGTQKFGYGTILVDNVCKLAHRTAWELTYGPIPDGLCVLHHCDNPPCVNPLHLHLGTRADNNRECVERGRKAMGKDHAKCKLSGFSVRTIRKLVSDGLRVPPLAELYGVQPGTIYRICAGTRRGGVV